MKEMKLKMDNVKLKMDNGGRIIWERTCRSYK